MSKIIIGIDPDSKAHGVAVYIDGKLISLQSKPLIMIYETLVNTFIPMVESGDFNIEVHMEDVCANNSAFTKKGIKNQAAKSAISRTLGMCQQSQIELERIFDHFDIKVVKHKISKMWKKDKAQFEKVTGWAGRSNEDTRSAAYFGFLGLK